jgi:hypothetical protein
MKQTQFNNGASQNKASEKDSVARKQPGPQPQGIGMAVAFDWGLAVQILLIPFLPLFFPNTGYFKALKLSPALTIAVSFLIALPFAALVAILGEGVRRGRRWTRPIQIGANSLGFLGGFATLPGLWQGSNEGNYWSLVTAVILLIFSPLIAWRLSRPATKQWFATVKSKDARRRHGGSWPWLILLWAIAGGVLQTIASAMNSSR